MIEKCDKPDVSEAKKDLYWIKGYDDKGAYAYMGIDFSMPYAAVIHLEVVRFSHTILRSLVWDWVGIKRILKENNVKIMAATKIGLIEDHEKFIRFIKIFGFTDVKQQFTAIQEL